MPKIRLTLLSIIEAIEKIEKYSSNFDDGEDFYYAQMNFDATMMQFVVIGEMISKLDEDFKNQNNNIPWQNIKDFRNIIAHNYFGIDSDEIWEIIHNHIPKLKIEIEKILEDLK
jgi:uncharacterized protein with HEPN domain